MKNGVLKLGFAPTRRVLTTPKAFNKDEARRIKDCIEAEIRTYPMLELVTLDTINDEGLLFDVADAEKAAALFLREQVDAVFIPHCNFGSEEAVAKLARAVGKPVLIWGPRDAAPDANGDRLTDTQCGMFATTKVLQQFGVKFTYITNCALRPKIQGGLRYLPPRRKRRQGHAASPDRPDRYQTGDFLEREGQRTGTDGEIRD